MGRAETINKIEALQEIRRRKAYDCFWSFCLYYNPLFFYKRIFLKSIANELQTLDHNYQNGKSYKLAISLPPRAGKSYIISLFSAWMLGRYPTESIMRNSCSDTLYNKLSYDTRDIIKSLLYRAVFNNILLQPDKQNVKGWNLTTSKQVGYFGAGVGGTVIGFGASMLAITDDLYKSLEEAMSDTINEKIWSWKQGTHDSRIEGNCCLIDIGTRWSETDVLGRLEASGKYDKVIRISALDENDETFCSDVHTTKYYRELRDDLDSTIWGAEYMQEPIEVKGTLFPKSDLNRFKLADIAGKRADGIIGSCDVADQGDDDLCAPFGKMFGDKIFITDIVFTKDAVEITEATLSQMIIDINCDRMRIESNNGGRIFSNNIKRIIGRHKCDVQSRQTTANKATRILMKSGYIKKSFVFLNETEYKPNSDYGRFMKQLTSYKKEGGNKHDDAPDGVTILAEFIDDMKKVRGIKRKN